MVKQIHTETNELVEVHPLFQFEQGSMGNSTALFVWTFEYVQEESDTDDELHPSHFPDVFEEVGDDSYILKDHDQFLFHCCSYATWHVAEKIDGVYDRSLGATVNEKELILALANAGFIEEADGPDLFS